MGVRSTPRAAAVSASACSWRERDSSRNFAAVTGNLLGWLADPDLANGISALSHELHALAKADV